MSVLIITSVGEIVVDLHTDLCPRTTDNFLKLCKMRFYNGCMFHNVLKDFVAQTGDPTGTGRGGGSVYRSLYGDQAPPFFDDEIRPELTHSKMGTVAMASAGNASQFYFTLRPNVESLDDGRHTVFGEVTEGFDTLSKINEAYVDGDGRPYKNIRIKHTYILHPSHLADLVHDDSSPIEKPKDEIAEERLEDTYVPLDEKLNPIQLEKMIRSKEARTNAVILETIGDIPAAEVKPPDNFLFVCHLNRMTRDEDLYTIFSRFGTVTSAEIIRDHKTGVSLGYAFVQFEATKACERAVEEMNDSVIDDRRVRVDFCQSVSQMWAPFRQDMQSAKKDRCFKRDSPDYRAQNRTHQGSKKNKDQDNVLLKDKNARRGRHNRKSYDLAFDGEDGTTADKQDRRNTSRRKIKKLDDWRSEPPHKGDLDRKGRYEDHTSYDRSGNRSYSRHGHNKHKSRSRVRSTRDESCHRTSNRYRET